MQCSRWWFWPLSSTSWGGNWDVDQCIKSHTDHGFLCKRVCLLRWKAQILKILQATSSEQPVGLCSAVHCRFRWVLSHLSSKRKWITLTSVLLSGFSVVFTLLDPVPQGLWAAYHVFGLLSCGHGLCTAILTFTAATCVKKQKQK